jgi:hypothetical protein
VLLLLGLLLFSMLSSMLVYALAALPLIHWMVVAVVMLRPHSQQLRHDFLGQLHLSRRS